MRILLISFMSICFMGCSTIYSENKSDQISIAIQELSFKTQEAVMIATVVSAYYAKYSKWPEKINDISKFSELNAININENLLNELIVLQDRNYNFRLTKGEKFDPLIEVFDVLLKTPIKDQQAIDGLINISSPKQHYQVSMPLNLKYREI